ncbi:Polycomb group RING finger protein 1 [Nymphon striatum]|nr:Polycomb group RING finger protein 1 [Nymphon striatum]
MQDTFDLVSGFSSLEFIRIRSPESEEWPTPNLVELLKQILLKFPAKFLRLHREHREYRENRDREIDAISACILISCILAILNNFHPKFHKNLVNFRDTSVKRVSCHLSDVTFWLRGGAFVVPEKSWKSSLCAPPVLLDHWKMVLSGTTRMRIQRMQCIRACHTTNVSMYLSIASPPLTWLDYRSDLNHARPTNDGHISHHDPLQRRCEASSRMSMIFVLKHCSFKHQKEAAFPVGFLSICCEVTDVAHLLTLSDPKGDREAMKSHLKLKDAAIHITCVLCKGYLVEATTISECLHSFCKSCIVKYILKHYCCPICSKPLPRLKPLQYLSERGGVVVPGRATNPEIAGSHPGSGAVLLFLSRKQGALDDRLQDIVYKVVPGLHKSEMKRRQKNERVKTNLFKTLNQDLNY